MNEKGKFQLWPELELQTLCRLPSRKQVLELIRIECQKRSDEIVLGETLETNRVRKPWDRRSFVLCNK